MNKIKKLSIITLVFLAACGEKKAQVTPTFQPDRSDYIVAANHVYLLACDSGAKKTARMVQDSIAFPIPYNTAVLSRFQLLKSLGKSGLIKAFDNQIRDILSEELEDLHISSSRFMTFSDKDYPENFLKRKVLIQRFLDPNRIALNKQVLERIKRKYENSRAMNIWQQTGVLYNQYYSTYDTLNVTFDKAVDRAVFYYVKECERQEDSAKMAYRTWSNDQAARTMKYVLKQP